MPINADKPHRWKADVAHSVDLYNGWFLRFAPVAYRQQRTEQTKRVETYLERTDFLRGLSADLLREHPALLSMLRMATSPPLARDRLIGLSYVSPNLVQSMEGNPARLPIRMAPNQLADELDRLAQVLNLLIDRDIFSWIDDAGAPDPATVHRAATVLADRMCGAAADPIIRNAQETRQLGALRDWLEARGYRHVPAKSIPNLATMSAGTFTFRLNVPVEAGSLSVNIPVDCVVAPHRMVPGQLPLLIEAKSAGDFTNTNKRRKEEAQKAGQLRRTYGPTVQFLLLLCGYFDVGYLGYEAAEGIDWVWEHRLDDLSGFGLDENPPPDSGPEPAPQIGDPVAPYDVSPVEARRLAFQRMLDEHKTAEARNKLGQFATPPTLALEVVSHALSWLPSDEPIRLLEPAMGTGAFVSALLRTVPTERVAAMRGFEIDAHYGAPARTLWADTPLDLTLADFTTQRPPETEAARFNLVVSNPPYVRHHHIESGHKLRLQQAVESAVGVRPSGLSGLYTYFLYLAERWMQADGIGCWLIPSEFLSVNYGRQVRDYLTRRVTLLHVHQYAAADVQFDDALVSSTVVFLRNAPPSPTHRVRFTHGGTLDRPARQMEIGLGDLRGRAKWNDLFRAPSRPSDEPTRRLDELVTIRRGIATGANGFFILTEAEAARRELPPEVLRPVLPSPRFVRSPIIEADERGMPLVERRALLLDCRWPESEIRLHHPTLWAYLQEGIALGVADGYLCRSRSPWYAQETRAVAPLLCSYMGRDPETPFRFFLNRSAATVTNVYLALYPKPPLQRLVDRAPETLVRLREILSTVSAEALISTGRTYGGGLHKLEPGELAALPVSLPSGDERVLRLPARQPTLF